MIAMNCPSIRLELKKWILWFIFFFFGKWNRFGNVNFLSHLIMPIKCHICMTTTCTWNVRFCCIQLQRFNEKNVQNVCSMLRFAHVLLHTNCPFINPYWSFNFTSPHCQFSWQPCNLWDLCTWDEWKGWKSPQPGSIMVDGQRKM